MIEPLLLTSARVSTFAGQRLLTGASGFFFEREGRLFLVTSRHVMVDEPSAHFPNRIEIELHTDASPPVFPCLCIATARACGGRAGIRAGRLMWR
jgi:hypothetical protein